MLDSMPKSFVEDGKLMGGGRADSSSCSHSSKKKRSYSLGNEGYNLAVKMKVVDLSTK